MDLMAKEISPMKNTPPALRRVPPVALALVAPALALAGCSHKPTIVGKWQGTVTQPRGTMNATFQFMPDGKETMGIQGSVGAMPVTMSAAGTYTVSDITLTQTLTSATVNGQAMPMPAAQSQPQSSPFTLDGDHLTLTNSATKQSLTLTRVKE